MKYDGGPGMLIDTVPPSVRWERINYCDHCHRDDLISTPTPAPLLGRGRRARLACRDRPRPRGSTVKHYFMVEVDSDSKPEQILDTVQNRLHLEFGDAYRISRSFGGTREWVEWLPPFDPVAHDGNL